MAIRLGKTTALLRARRDFDRAAGVGGVRFDSERGGERLLALRRLRPGELSGDEAGRAILCLLNQQRDRAGLRDLRPRPQAREGRPASQPAHGRHRLLRPRLLRRERAREAAARTSAISAAACSRWAYGENIAWGLKGWGTPEAIVHAWMDSPPHRANILNGRLPRDRRSPSRGHPRGRARAGRDLHHGLRPPRRLTAASPAGVRESLGGHGLLLWPRSSPAAGRAAITLALVLRAAGDRRHAPGAAARLLAATGAWLFHQPSLADVVICFGLGAYLVVHGLARVL